MWMHTHPRSHQLVTLTQQISIMSKVPATFYHAGCPVCLEAESILTQHLDPTRVNVEVVHLGTSKGRIAEAEARGVKSVPALVLDGRALHINFGAPLDALK
jgi:hypothetical protein